MLDLNLIRENPVHFKDVLGKRGYLFDTKKFKKIDEARKKAQTPVSYTHLTLPTKA